MASALGWGLTERPSTTVVTASGGGSGLDGGTGTRRLHQREKDAGRWALRTPGRSYDAEPRRADLTEPAPTVALGHNASAWCWERPSTTVQGTPRIAQPGHHERQFRDSIPVELWELGVLQDFPRDHPWEAAGTKEAQSRCVGNAIPVLLAKAILGALTDQAREAVA
jgi:site-specific DNA-cytosine methylase